MALQSRIRMLADSILLCADEDDAGELIFEEGLVDGNLQTVLRALYIGDLNVDTLQMEDASVTLPNIAVQVATLPDVRANFTTFLEDEFVIRSTLGSTIFLQTQSEILVRGQESQPPILATVRCRINGVTRDSFGGIAAPTRRVRFVIDTIPATGLDQTINIQWQIASNNPLAGVQADAGSQILRVAMKR
jgi:hypothetical protein